MSTDHRALAVSTFNRCWDLLETESPTVEHHTELLTVAFTSRYHWLEAGELQQWILSDWMVARAAGAAGLGDLAIRFALRAQAALNNELPDWLVASVAEGVARAYSDAGHEAETIEWIAKAQSLVAAIEGDEDRALIASQLDEVIAR